ncbi:MAG: membrane protein insertase YidC, partial [Gammaproteobacteria bacterium]
MDNQRNILLVALVLIGFLIWQQWRIDHAPKPEGAAPVAEQGGAAGPQAAGGQAGTQQDVPPAAAAAPEASPQSASATAASRIIHVRTDVLDLRIDTRGGTLVR